MHTFVDPLYRARALFADAVSMVSEEVRLNQATNAGVQGMSQSNSSFRELMTKSRLSCPRQIPFRLALA
jgi:hypothetical protein